MQIKKTHVPKLRMHNIYHVQIKHCVMSNLYTDFFVIKYTMDNAKLLFLNQFLLQVTGSPVTAGWPGCTRC